MYRLCIDYKSNLDNGISKKIDILEDPIEASVCLAREFQEAMTSLCFGWCIRASLVKYIFGDNEYQIFFHNFLKEYFDNYLCPNFVHGYSMYPKYLHFVQSSSLTTILYG